MTSVPRVPTLGSAEALALAATRLGVVFDRDALDARFVAHPAGLSLRALVEIAPELGMEARAFRSNPAGLSDASLPAVVHLVDRATDESGFALLTEVTGDGVRLVTDTADGESFVTTEAFTDSWSGILVSVARVAGASPAAALSPRGPFGRFRAWYWKDDPLARAALAGRILGGGLMIALATWSAVRFGAARGSALVSMLAVAVVLLSAVGAVLSATLFYKGRRTLVAGVTPRLASTVCGRGRYSDCLGVLATRYSRVAGIDWASIGLALFASNLLLFAMGAMLSDAGRENLFSWLAVTYLIEVPGALFFVAIQIWPLRRICPLCMGVHAIVLGLALLGVAHLAADGGLLTVSSLIPFAAAHLAAFFGALAIVLPLLSFGLEAKVSRVRLGWVAATPWGALAEIAGRPPIAIPIPEAPIRLGHAKAPFRLDVLAHPFCSGCGPVVIAMRDIARKFDPHVTVGIHVPVRDMGSEVDRALCTALAAAGLAAGGERAVEAFLEMKQNPRPAFAAAANGVSDVLALLLGGHAISSARSDLGRATAILEDANRFADAIERGTPTLLVNGRLWDGTVEDLDALLSSYSPLLADVLQIPRSSPVAGEAPGSDRTPEARASEP